jgi:Bromodomain
MESNPAKTNTEATANEENDTSQSSSLTPDQQAHCERVLNAICKLSAAGPFLEPVDPIQAKAPDYYEIITRPMDLGTIDKKLKSRAGPKRIDHPYADLQEFVDDVNLVFDNCFKYNGSTHAVSQLAIRVKDTFEERMKTAPGGQVRIGFAFTSAF